MRAGVAVENARVHGVRTHIATTLQRSLLPPRLPAVPGLTIAARFRAAGEATEVGGDFYDLFAVDGAWMVVMGDVTGKGPEAAAITSLARYTMRTAAVYEASPSGGARAAQRRARRRPRPPPDLHGRRGADRRRRRRLRGRSRSPAAATPRRSACHDGRAEPVAAAGPLLGAFEIRPLAETVVRLGAGREPRALHRRRHRHARRRRAASATERLAASWPRRAASSRTRSPTASTARCVAFEEGPQRDDVALLVLQASGGPGGEASLVAVGSDRSDAA